MGRPLKKKFFGQPESGQKILTLNSVVLDETTGPETGYWIVRQVGTGRYQVTNGTTVGVVRLVGTPAALPGEANIIVKPFGKADEYARVIFNRTVSTWAGVNWMWSVVPATEEGQADLPLVDSIGPSDEDLVEEINDATTGAEIVDLIKENPTRFMDAATAEVFEELTPSSRQTAVGDGVAEWAQIYGPYTDMAALQAAVLLHTETEAHKQALIVGADNATTVAALKASYEATVPVVAADRLNMINDLRASAVPAAITRADELDVEDFTITFQDFAEMIANDEVTDAMYQYILDGRNALSSGKFFGTARMLPIIAEALVL